MRQMISRPWRGALPLALGACALLMPGSPVRALGLMGGVLLARGLSLGAGGALRAAAGSVVRASRLRGNLLTAALLAIAGGAVSTALCTLDLPVLSAIGFWNGAAGALINLAQLFADRLYASRERGSAAAYDLIIAALAAVGLLISGDDTWLTAALAGCGTLAGILLLAGLKDAGPVQPGFRVLKFAPLALMRGWFFPAVITAGTLFSTNLTANIAAALIGVTILEWCEPAFRRSAEESRGCGAALAITAALWTAFCVAGSRHEALMPEYYSVARWVSPICMWTVSLGCFGAAITGLNLDVRRIGVCGLILLSMACAAEYMTGYAVLGYGDALGWAALGLSAACVLLSLPDIAAVLRSARARRIQKRRA